MAEPDHTVLARLTGLPIRLFSNPQYDVLSDLSDKRVGLLSDVDHVIACIDQARHVVIRLLDDSDACEEARHHPWHTTSPHWPLPPAAYDSLLMATHLLDLYAERLMHINEV